jgi:hypothetical protein
MVRKVNRLQLKVYSFSILQRAKGLIEAAAFSFEFIRGFGIEGEHVKMVRNSQASVDGFGKASGFDAVKIAGDAALGFVAVYREQGDIDGQRL